MTRDLAAFRGKVVRGSLGEVAQRTGQSLEEAFLEVDAVVMLDVSGSMYSEGAQPGRTRYELAVEALSRLQEGNPGKVALVAFSSFPVFCSSGYPPTPCGATNVAEVLGFVKVADVPGMRFLLISDGEPTDSEVMSFDLARSFGQRIDTVYVGPRGGPGRGFLERLSRESGGSHRDDYAVQNLLTVATGLLEYAKERQDGESETCP